MTKPRDLETRVAALEARMEVVASDAAAARHLAAARDRDIADLGIKVDANRKAINALGIQTAARFDQMDARFEQMDARFEQVDARFEQVDARFEQVDARFDQVDARFEQVDRELSEIRGTLGVAAVGQQQIVDMLTTLIERDEQ